MTRADHADQIQPAQKNLTASPFLCSKGRGLSISGADEAQAGRLRSAESLSAKDKGRCTLGPKRCANYYCPMPPQPNREAEQDTEHSREVDAAIFLLNQSDHHRQNRKVIRNVRRAVNLKAEIAASVIRENARCAYMRRKP